MMKQTKLFAPTLKEVPADAEAKSHQLMLKGGYIRQVAGGVYSYLPLAMRSLNKIEKIIREEMNAIGSNQMLVSNIIPADYWIESGRYNTYGPELFKFKNRDDRDFILGPTHEETFTKLISEVKSYKKFPLSLYQIQTKFRDEKRPRFGLLRGREFLMKDAYSFSVDQKGLDTAYNDMAEAYKKIFNRIGLKYLVINADAGAMGGSDSQEFNAIAEIGEDVVAFTENGYAANLEMAVAAFEEQSVTSTAKQEIVETPNIKTAQEVADFLKLDLADISKTIVFNADGKLVAVVVPGDFEVNEVKVKNYLNANELSLAEENKVVETFGAHFGSLGPIGLSEVQILVDRQLKNKEVFVVGANTDGKHMINVNANRDLSDTEFDDFVFAKEGQQAVDNSGVLKLNKGIEIGHVFKLGTRYSKKMGAQVQGEDGSMIDLIMGSYGIGVSRLLSAIVEQNTDDNGIIWPKAVSPFDVHVIPVNYDDEIQHKLTDEIVQKLESSGLDVLVDDRSERPGVKFADADLIGSPLRITVGRNAPDGIVEIKKRTDEKAQEIKLSETLIELNQFL